MRIKAILKEKGLPSDVVRKSAIVSYEAEINIVSYARKGFINLTVTPENVEIEAADEGPGIPNIEQAMEQGYSTASQQIREMGLAPAWDFTISISTLTNSISHRK